MLALEKHSNRAQEIEKEREKKAYNVKINNCYNLQTLEVISIFFSFYEESSRTAGNRQDREYFLMTSTRAVTSLLLVLSHGLLLVLTILYTSFYSYL